MRLSSVCAAACAVFSVGMAVPAPIGGSDVAIVKRDYSAELASAAKRNELEPYLNEFVTLDKKDLDILTTFFSAIGLTGISTGALNILAQNTLTEPLLVESVVSFIKVVGITDLIDAAAYSNLAQKIIDLALTDSAFLPGAYEIINGLTDGSTTAPTSGGLDVLGLVNDLASLPGLVTSEVSSALSEVSSALGIDQVASGVASGVTSGISAVLNPVFSILGVSGSSDDVAAASESLSSLATATTVVATASFTGSATASTASVTASVTGSASTTGAASATSAAASSSSSSSGGIFGSIISTIGNFFGSIFKRDSEPTYYTETVVKRDNAVLDSLLDSLVQSGLVISIIQDLFDTSANYPFVRDVITKIVQDEVFTIADLSSALDSTNLLNTAVINFLTDNDLNIQF